MLFGILFGVIKESDFFMVCVGCKLEKELLDGGYDSRDFVCTCSLSERLFGFCKSGIQNVLVLPLIIVLSAIFIPVTILEKVLE